MVQIFKLEIQIENLNDHDDDRYYKYHMATMNQGRYHGQVGLLGGTLGRGPVVKGQDRQLSIAFPGLKFVRR